MTLYTNRPYHPKPKKTPKKRNLVPPTKPDRSKLSKQRKINIQQFPTSTSQINWKSTIHKGLTQEAIDVNQSGLYAMKSADEHSFHTLTTSPAASIKVTEDSEYCKICTSLGKYCRGKLGLSSDWDKEDNNTKENDQIQPEASPNLFIMPTHTLKLPKHYITKYFDCMSSETPIIYIPKDKQKCDIIVAQQEHNTTVHKNLDQDSLKNID